MKNNYIAKILLIVSVVFFAACRQKENATVHQQEEAITYYTCPMHPSVVQNAPGKCPVCSMDLVQQNRSTSEQHSPNDSSQFSGIVKQNDYAKTTSTIRPESGTRIIPMKLEGIVNYDARKQVSISSRVAGRIERMMVRYNYQPIRRGELIMEIYSPELAAAQRELLYLHQSDPGNPMLQRARERLLLLGVTAAQINQVLKTGKPLYSVPVYSNVSGYIMEKSIANQTDLPIGQPLAASSSNGMGAMQTSEQPTASTISTPMNSPVMIREGQYVNAGQSLFVVYESNSLVAEFAIHPSMANDLSKGQNILIANGEEFIMASIGLIEPVLQNGQNFSRARVYLKKADLPVGQLLSAHTSIVKRKGWWIPRESAVQLGSKMIVFRKIDGGFKPYEVRAGSITEYSIQLLNDVSDWEVAAKAQFLTDSESFINPEPIESKK